MEEQQVDPKIRTPEKSQIEIPTIISPNAAELMPQELPENLIEQTLIIVKPDGVESRRMFEILSRFEKTGLTFEDGFVTQVDEDFAKIHYEETLKKVPPEIGKKITGYLTSGKIMPTVWSGANAVEKARILCGQNADPLKCPPGTIRFDFSLGSKYFANKTGGFLVNIIHTSDSIQAAKKEIDLWFNTHFEKLSKALMRSK